MFQAKVESKCINSEFRRFYRVLLCATVCRVSSFAFGSLCVARSVLVLLFTAVRCCCASMFASSELYVPTLLRLFRLFSLFHIDERTNKPGARLPAFTKP